ncbi:MAG: DUF1844 domain-containing protein [Verrucomicrobiota bacterium]
MASESESESLSEFSRFVIAHTQNTGLALGQIPHPTTGETAVNLRMARRMIDQLAMLREKTANNLDAPETQVLALGLDNLEKLYSQVEQSQARPAEEPALLTEQEEEEL